MDEHSCENVSARLPEEHRQQHPVGQTGTIQQDFQNAHLRRQTSCGPQCSTRHYNGHSPKKERVFVYEWKRGFVLLKLCKERFSQSQKKPASF